MKSFEKICLVFLFCISAFYLGAQTQVTYKLTYDFNTQTYTVSMRSNTAYSPPLSRLASSTQFTIVVPHVAGQWQVNNLTGLINTATSLGWGFSYLDGTTVGQTHDYIFFAPSNAGSYTPFNIPANADLSLFSFKSGSGCIGDLYLFDNNADPLNSIPSVNADNNMVILGAGTGNRYISNASGSITCVPPCAANAGTLSY